MLCLTIKSLRLEWGIHWQIRQLEWVGVEFSRKPYQVAAQILFVR